MPGKINNSMRARGSEAAFASLVNFSILFFFLFWFDSCEVVVTRGSSYRKEMNNYEELGEG